MNNISRFSISPKGYGESAKRAGTSSNNSLPNNEINSRYSIAQISYDYFKHITTNFLQETASRQIIAFCAITVR